LALRHGPSRSESMPVENAHHLEPDSPNRFARKPPGGTGRASTADAPEGTAGRDLPGAKPAGRLAVGGREPPCLKRRTMASRRRWSQRLGRSREIALDTALLDDRVPADHRPTSAPWREAAPEQHRGKQSKQASNHQDDPNCVDVNPEASTSTAKVRMAPTTNRKMLKPMPTVTPPRTLRLCGHGCYRQVVPSSEERRRLLRRYAG
jgi:hypothetical protein